MDPMLIATAIQAIAPLVAGAIGDALAAGDKAKAQKLADEAMSKYKNILPPQLQKAAAEQQQGTEFDKIAQDPRLRQMQMKALDSLGAEVDAQGMTPQDRAAYQQAEAKAGTQEAGFRGALEQQMAQRGLGGVGAYASALANQQGTVNRSAMQGVQIASDSRDRYLNAVNALGGMASGVRGQEYGQAAQRAGAQDTINKGNTALRWDAQQYNLGLPQQDFQNQMALAKAQSDAAWKGSGYYSGKAVDTQKSAQGYGEAIAGGADVAGKGYTSYRDDKRKHPEDYHP